MKNDFFYAKILDIQQEYKNILIKISEPFLKGLDIDEILDELMIFWHNYENIVRGFAEYILSERDSYLFTGVCHLDVDSKDAYPFVLLGNCHIMDDRVNEYAYIISQTPDSNLAKELKKHLVIAIQDNINIISDYDNEILLLPIRSLINVSDIRGLTEKFFLSMFKTKYDNLGEYKKYNDKITDVEKNIRDIVKKRVRFGDTDKVEASFIENFQRAVKNKKDILESNLSEADQFLFLISGYMNQAICIMNVCLDFNLTPYVRNYTTFYYMTLLYEIIDKDDCSKLFFKSLVAKIIYNKFDRERVKLINFNKFFESQKNINFNDEVFSELSKENIDYNNISISNIKTIVDIKLDLLYRTLNIN